MGKLEDVMRSEISRLARKEIRAKCVPLAREVRALRRTVRGLSKTVAALEKVGGAAAVAQAAKTAKLQAAPEEVKKARFSAALCRKLRKRLGLTQGQLGALISVSSTTVAFWEQGRNRPTEASKATLVALRKLGRREVKRILQGKASGH